MASLKPIAISDKAFQRIKKRHEMVKRQPKKLPTINKFAYKMGQQFGKDYGEIKKLLPYTDQIENETVRQDLVNMAKGLRDHLIKFINALEK